MDQGRCAILDDFLGCSICHQVMPSLQQLKLHEFKQHGTICSARQCVGELNDCPTCLRRYPTRSQAIVHLRNNKTCASFGTCAIRYPEELVKQMDDEEDQRLAANKSKGMFDCAAASHLPNIAGPLCWQYTAAFKTRPRIHEVSREPISLDELIIA